MAVINGTNCGFVTVEPSGDPAGSPEAGETKAYAFKCITPAGPGRVKKMGWFCDSISEECNFEVGIYDHHVGDNNPEDIVGVARTNAKGTGTGWKRVTGMNILLSGSTIHWLGLQIDDTASPTYINYRNDGGYKSDARFGAATLPDPWGASMSEVGRLLAVYAVWEPVVEDARARMGSISKIPLSADVVPGLY